MMSDYKSIDQVVKDIINAALLHHTMDRRTTFGMAGFLDDALNGTATCLLTGGYPGQLTAIQRDNSVLAAQYRNFKNAFPEHTCRFSVLKGDICRDYVEVADVWTRGSLVDLWNFDFMGTFFGETTLTIQRLLENPSLGGLRSDALGTLVAFTFQAIANGNLLVKLKNHPMWSDRVKLYNEMKGWSLQHVAQFYFDEIKTISDSYQPPCVSFEAVQLQPSPGHEQNCFQNGIVYRGRHARDSTMMFVLYRVRHDVGCTEHHTPVNPGKRKVCDVEGDELIALEKEATSSEMDSEVVFQEQATSSEMDSEVVFQEQSASSEMGSDVVDMSIERCEQDGTDELIETDSDSEWSLYETDGDDAESDDSNGEIDSDESDDLSDGISSDDESSDNSDNDIFTPFYPSSIATIHPSDLSMADLFPHQIRMVQAVNDGTSRGYISAICGSGKSLAMTICCKTVKVSVIFVPLKQLVEQFYRQYLEKDLSVQAYRVNSNHVEAVPSPHPGKCTIYIANYDSAHRLRALGVKFDLICWDEAHLTTSKKRRLVCSPLSEGENPEHIDASAVQLDAAKQIFWTATPNGGMRRHPEVYGKMLMEYTFSEAVHDKIIKSFGIYISCYKEDNGFDDSPEGQLDRIIYLTGKFIENEGCKRILIYVNRVEDADDLISVERMRRKRSRFSKDFKMSFLSSQTTPKQRDKIFAEFNWENDDMVHVIVSCRTISVGVDLPNCDTVVFAATSTNVASNIQRGCRPCRLTKKERELGDYGHAKLFFPINTSATEVRDCVGKVQDEKVHRAIRNNPLEIPMMILALLREGR